MDNLRPRAIRTEPIRVAALTGGVRIPSARFRVRQYVKPLALLGILIREHISRTGEYPPRSQWLRPAWFAGGVVEGIERALATQSSEIVLFQRELISTFVTWESCFRRPRILDVDDAIWLHRRGAFAGKLARLCDAVICGNNYLADYFSRFNRRVFVMPTGIDTDHFAPSVKTTGSRPVIGWSGTSSNLRQIETVEFALRTILRQFPEARLRVICDKPPRFLTLPPHQVEWLRWSPDIEVSAIQDFSVGVMPLEDSDWSRGKCAFKMLTYMACGVPVVVSPVGVNVEILTAGEIGYGATTNDDWTAALAAILENPERARDMGANGRSVVEEHYSVRVLAPRLASVFRSLT